MERLAIIKRTDLARRTRQMVDRVRRGDTLIVESYGEEQVVLLDILDYRIMRAVAAYHQLPSHPSSMSDPDLHPQGLAEANLSSDIQIRYDQVIAAYLDEQISLGRAAKLLGLVRYELDDCFQRLNISRRLGAETAAEAQSEIDAALAE